MKYFFIVSVIAVFVVLGAGCSNDHDSVQHGNMEHHKGMKMEHHEGSQMSSEKTEMMKQTVCPVMGGKITSKKYYADHNGKRVYFCCSACINTFNKDPEKYIKKLEDQDVELEKIK